MKTTKKDVIKVLRGESHLSAINYKGCYFQYCANNMTYKDCNEHIKEKLEKI